MSSSASKKKKKIRKKRKKKKVVQAAVTKVVQWRLPTFPYETQRNQVIIGGKVKTTADILDVPGKSNTGYDFTKKCLQQVPSNGMDINEFEDNNDINKNKVEEVNDVAQIQKDELNDGLIDEVCDLNECEDGAEESCLCDSDVDERIVMGDNLSNNKSQSCHFTVTARVIDFHRKISIKTRLGYPIAVKMSLKPKVRSSYRAGVS